MTWATSRPNGSIPVLGSQRPKTLARCTSRAARYCTAPPRVYSNSVRGRRPGAAGTEAWRRTRAWMEAFSSALSTEASSPRGWPSRTLAYRSRTPPALAAKAGSRGKIHDRTRHGLIASADSHRQIVVPETDATMPCCTAARARSGQCQRASGTPWVAGSSQARALTATTTSGGKGRAPSAPRQVTQPGQALAAEPLAPLGNHLARGVEPGGDLVVA